MKTKKCNFQDGRATREVRIVFTNGHEARYSYCDKHANEVVTRGPVGRFVSRVEHVGRIPADA